MVLNRRTSVYPFYDSTQTLHSVGSHYYPTQTLHCVPKHYDSTQTLSHTIMIITFWSRVQCLAWWWWYHSLTPTPKGSYSAKTGDNDCNINSSRYRLRTALCESIRSQAKSEQNVRQDLTARVRHGEAALMHPQCLGRITISTCTF